MNEDSQGVNALEARNWLRNNKNESALATNRFVDTRTALEFIEKLYSLGAVEILVDNVMDEEQRIKEEGGPYADSLIVKLPLEPEKRRVLFRIFSEESEKEGFGPVEDKGENMFTLWWD